MRELNKSIFFTRAELELIYKALSEYSPDEPDHKLIKVGLTLKIGDDLINAYKFELLGRNQRNDNKNQHCGVYRFYYSTIYFNMFSTYD